MTAGSGGLAAKEDSAMFQSLCESCTSMREVVTPRGSRFLLCQLSKTDPQYPKYPPQPVVRCPGYEPGSHIEDESKESSDE